MKNNIKFYIFFVEYLIHYKSHFTSDINSYPFNEDIANLILTSQAFTTEEKVYHTLHSCFPMILV